MNAIVKSGGKQFRVKAGDVVRVPLIEAEVGSDVVLEDVLQVSTGSAALIGRPKVANAKVSATVLRHDRDRKILVYTYKRRKGYEKRRGHRQGFTEIRIKDIKAGA